MSPVEPRESATSAIAPVASSLGYCELLRELVLPLQGNLVQTKAELQTRLRAMLSAAEIMQVVPEESYEGLPRDLHDEIVASDTRNLRKLLFHHYLADNPTSAIQQLNKTEYIKAKDSPILQ